MLRADLHVHTYCSDGRLSPAEVAEEAERNGLRLVAITDHDCMLAGKELNSVKENTGVKVITGIEVSAYLKDVKIHTLGYNLDEEKPDVKNFLESLYNGSLKRADDVVRKLNKNGVKITLDEVMNRRTLKNSPVHIMHVAFACAEKGYCQGNPFAFFNEFLCWGKCAYSCICRPNPEETVEMIYANGGLASLAHPGRIDLEADALINLVEKLVSCGLGGIEAVYSTHTVTETAYYKEMAKTYRLLVTGGSATHFNGGRCRIGTPEFYLDEALAEKLKIDT